MTGTDKWAGDRYLLLICLELTQKWNRNWKERWRTRHQALGRCNHKRIEHIRFQMFYLFHFHTNLFLNQSGLPTNDRTPKPAPKYSFYLFLDRRMAETQRTIIALRCYWLSSWKHRFYPNQSFFHPYLIYWVNRSCIQLDKKSVIGMLIFQLLILVCLFTIGNSHEQIIPDNRGNWFFSYKNCDITLPCHECPANAVSDLFFFDSCRRWRNVRILAM